MAGGFPSLVIDSKKEFATKYGLKADYWQHFDPKKFPEVLGYLKTNLKDLANHYHALYQDKKHAKAKGANFKEALHWYREFLASFPKDAESPAINYQLADLLLENRSFGEAAVEFEKTAYAYPRHENPPRPATPRCTPTGSTSAPSRRRRQGPGQAGGGAQLAEVCRHLPEARKGGGRPRSRRGRPLRDEGL